MGGLSVLLKDCREHSLALFSLGIGLIAVVLLSLTQQRAAEFTMSSFEVVRFALITVVPLIALIVGNRLIVREYLGGTRGFMESLPIRPVTPLVVKFFTGWLYLLTMGVALVCIAALLADVAEFINQRYLTLLLVKTSAIITLYWSIVFFASFTGKLRLLIYLIIGLALLVLFDLPGFDETRLAPVALIDHQLFIFEREMVPWTDLLETLALSLVFVIAAFTLALINEGSVAEQLGKPLNRRSLAAIGILSIGILGVYQNLQEKWDNSGTEFSGDTVLRNELPPVEISYLSQAHLPQAQIIEENLKRIIDKLQADTGMSTTPRVQIALNTNIERTEIYPVYNDGVLVTANFSDYNDYEHSMLNSIAMHHLLLMLTNGRWDYETRHWLLDGLARWWAEGGEKSPDSLNNAEHFTRALLALRRLSPNSNPLLSWETATDLYGFEAVEALSYTALLYLAERTSVDTIVQLTTSYINEKPGASSAEWVNRMLNRDPERFERITGIDFEQFTNDWLDWLGPHQHDPLVSELLALVPAIDGHVESVIDDKGVAWLEASYKPQQLRQTENSNQPQQKLQNGVTGTCALRHQRTSAYDIETEVHAKERDRQPCLTDKLAHRIDVPYSAGDRAYVVLQYEHERFARPISLWTGRVSF